MTPLTSGPRRSSARFLRCSECHAPLAHDQHYCVECGERRGSLPHGLAALIGVGLAHHAQDELAASSALAATRSNKMGSRGDTVLLSPAVSAVAVMALLAFGVLVGSAVSPAQESSAAAPLVVAVVSPTSASSPPVAAQTSSPPE